MIVFIWDAFDERQAQLTEAGVLSSGPGCRCIRLGSDAAAAMNRELSDYREPFFLVLEAGDIVSPEFFAAADGWLEGAEERDAGIIVLAGSGDRETVRTGLPPAAPLFWRTTAVLGDGSAGGFAERGLLPFERYTLLERKLRLDPAWNWKTFRTDAFRPRFRPQRSPRWMKAEQEWAYLSPILAAQPPYSAAAADPCLSVVICTYNDSEYVLWAVRSVCAQTVGDWELIIVDDGSTDGTDAVLRESPMLRDSRIRVIRSAVNGGKASALNVALSAAKGRWLLELDADDWLAPDCLERLARHAGGTGDDTGAFYAGHAEWQERMNKKLVLGGSRAAQAMSPERLLRQPVALAPRMFRVSVLKRIGGWLTAAPSGGRLYEDVQMLIRIMLDHSVIAIPGVLYHRRVRRSSTTQRSKACYEAWRDWMAETVGPSRLNG